MVDRMIWYQTRTIESRLLAGDRLAKAWAGGIPIATATGGLIFFFFLRAYQYGS